MEGEPGLLAAASVAIILGNAFFVAAEYALVGARRSKVEALARQGNPSAKLVREALKDLSKSVAGLQIAVTMLGIGVGTVTEPFLHRALQDLVGGVDPWVSMALSFLLATYLLVVIGELVPKYIALRDPDRVSLFVVRPMRVVVLLLTPLVWIAERSAHLILRLFRVEPGKLGSEAVPKDELLLMVRAGPSEGVLDKAQAELVSRALRLDALTADDIMIHRLDVKWLDMGSSKEQVLSALAEIPYSRIPVCRGDIDDVAGILYLHDIVAHLQDAEFSLESLLRPVVAIPENLPLDKIVARMREDHTQMLIVMDEYGGTSGLITLEDVVEEVFGELEDRLEVERPPIEVRPSGRVSARGDVRFDELVAKLGIELVEEPTTDTLAEMIVTAIERVPKLGDTVQTPIGLLRVENMARHRITRVSLRRSSQ